MATTTSREDFLGRAVGSTTDTFGRSLRRTARANTTAGALGQEIQFVCGTKYTVTLAGTSAASGPGVLRPIQRGTAL